MRNSRIAIILIFAMLICIMPNNTINATENSVEKTNFKFIESSDLCNIYYTYEEAGKSYSVYETCNDDLSIINTEIYLNDDNGQKLIEKFETHMNTIDEVLYITKYCDGKKLESYSIDLASNSQSSRNTRCVSGITYDGNVYYDGRTGKYYTGWYYDSTMIGSNFIPKVTLSATISVVAAILELRYPLISPVVAGVQEIAQALIAENISTVYFEKDIYHVNQITYPNKQLYGTPVGQKVYARFYSDKNRTHFVESAEYENHYPEKWPDGLFIGKDHY